MIRVAVLTNELNNTDGVTNHIHDLIKGFQNYSKEVEFCIITGKNNAVEKFTNLGVDVITLPKFTHAERSAVNFMVNAFRLISIIQTRQIHILHSHDHYHANMATSCKLLISVSTVQTNHGIIHNGGFFPHLCAEKYITINNHIVEHFSESYPGKYRRSSFIRCGIPYLKKNKDSHSKIAFIAAGRLVNEKGFDTYIKAVNGLPQDVFEKAIFYLAGEGIEKDSILKLNISLGSKVEYLGNIENLQEFLFKTDVLVNPSRSPSEGFPRTIVEAVFAKNLIITSNFIGVNHDFTADKDGLQFEIDDVEELKKQILYSIEFPDLVLRMRDSFFRKAQDIFSVEKMVRDTEKVYKDVIIS